MPDLAIVLMCYALFWLARIRFVARAIRAPFRRGSGWLFDRRLHGDAWPGSARAIVHAYWLRMALPFAIDVPILWAVFGAHQYVLSVLLIIAGGALQTLNHATAVNSAMRRAEAETLVQLMAPPGGFALSLKPRRLRDYMLPSLEIAATACNIAGLAWLALIEARSAAPRGVWALYGVPLFLLYVQAGALVAKLIVIEWRDPLSAEFGQREAIASEALRRHRARAFDIIRAAAAASVLFWPVKVATSHGGALDVAAVFFSCAVAIAIAISSGRTRCRQELDRLVSAAPPAPAPEAATRSWPVCVSSSSAVPILASRLGWSLNIAHRHAQAAVLYLVGFVALATRLVLG